MPSTPADIPFIKRQIGTCLRIAGECGDPKVATALRRLAEAFAERAIALGAGADAEAGLRQSMRRRSAPLSRGRCRSLP